MSATTRIFGSSSGQSDALDGRRSKAGVQDQVEGAAMPKKNEESTDARDGEDDLNDIVEEPLYKDFSRYIRNTSGKVVIDALPIKRSEGRAPPNCQTATCWAAVTRLKYRFGAPSVSSTTSP